MARSDNRPVGSPLERCAGIWIAAHAQGMSPPLGSIPAVVPYDHNGMRFESGVADLTSRDDVTDVVHQEGRGGISLFVRVGPAERPGRQQTEKRGRHESA